MHQSHVDIRYHIRIAKNSRSVTSRQSLDLLPGIGASSVMFREIKGAESTQTTRKPEESSDRILDLGLLMMKVWLDQTVYVLCSRFTLRSTKTRCYSGKSSSVQRCACLRRNCCGRHCGWGAFGEHVKFASLLGIGLWLPIWAWQHSRSR